MNGRQFLHIVELRTKVVGVSSFALGSLYAWRMQSAVNIPLFVLTGISVLCIDMGTTAFNTLFDFIRGTDNGKFNRERDKVLVHEGVSPASAFAVAVLLYALAAFTGIAVAMQSNPIVPILGIGGMAIGFLYTGGPFPIAGTPAGELFAGGFLGTALFVVSFTVQAGQPSWHSAAASLPLFFLIAAILTVNNTCDIAGDTAAGRKTLSILIGRKCGELLVYFSVIAAHIVVIPLVFLNQYPIAAGPAAALSLVFAGTEFRRMHKRGFSHESKGGSMKSIVRIFSLFAGSLIFSMIGDVII